jgi:hypothetical protein
MSISTAAARRLFILCGLIPLPELTQEEVDYLFRRLVEDAPADGPPVGPEGGPGEPGA